MSQKISVSYGRNFLYLNFFYFSLIKRKRTEVFNIFCREINPKKSETILDIGTTSSIDEHENLIIGKYPHKSKISCLSNQQLKKVQIKYPAIKTYKGDGKNLKFKNNAFDYSISSATIEHVGSFAEQARFVKESYRVAKKKVFITTPNRFFPIDFHTRLPFIHWLPKTIHRKILNFLGENYLNKEKNLNLLDSRELSKICDSIGIKKYKIYRLNFLGMCSNLLLTIDKKN